jgi:predicted glycosyl hydrolase (DUF1957 family)
MKALALVVELHHPPPGPGEPAGPDWSAAAAETYWPLVRAVAGLANHRAGAVLTLAVSPGWTALASDPIARGGARRALERRANDDPDAEPLRAFALDEWGGDLLAPLRRAAEEGSVELIPTASSHAWLPSVAADPLIARAQATLAADDHARRFGLLPQGFWLPFRAYRPGLEGVLAASGLRYFGVDAEAFVRGTTLPPGREFGALVTPPGVAAFGVSAEGSRLALESATGEGGVAKRAARFVEGWRRLAAVAERAGVMSPVCLAAVSAHDLGGGGADWLSEVVRRAAWLGDAMLTTPARVLDRAPEWPVGRPGPSAGGWFSVRPGGSDLLDRCRSAADVLAGAVARARGAGPLVRRAIAQMTRALLLAQRVDWDTVPGFALGPLAGLDRGERHLARFHELAGMLAAGCVDAPRLALQEAGPPYLPEINLERLANGG